MQYVCTSVASDDLRLLLPLSTFLPLDFVLGAAAAAFSLFSSLVAHTKGHLLFRCE